MDDPLKILNLINTGENQSLDLKLKIDLDSAFGRSELIKDIIAIANSSQESGYLLLGVDDQKNVIGIQTLDEERIQQLSHTYINPPVLLDCCCVALDPSQPNVGVIKITPTDKPHKVARAIGNLEQNNVYVRRGTVIMKASPEDIIRMRDESHLSKEHYQYLRSAQTHAKLGNLQSAVKSYDKAIDLVPNASLFAERGRIYARLYGELKEQMLSKPNWLQISRIKNQKQKDEAEAELRRLSQLERNYLALSLKDFSNAIKIAESEQFEKEIRLERLEFNATASSWPDDFEQDLEWLKSHATGKEFGKVCYLEATIIEVHTDSYLFRHCIDCSSSAIQVIQLLNRAIEHEFVAFPVYFLRAQAHYGLFNYGSALEDIKKALELGPQRDILQKYLAFQANVLVQTGQYEQAVSIYRQIKKQFGKIPLDYFDATFQLLEALLCRSAISYTFGEQNDPSGITVDLLQQSMRLLSPWNKQQMKQEFPITVELLEKLLNQRL